MRMMMGDDAMFNLRWDAQRSALLGSMATLYREEAFVDTTIVADNKIFKAHKLLLSASSSYLRNILESVPATQHAVICMPQVSSIDMGNLLRFIYEGQIKINRRSLRPFLTTAKLLRIKGMDFEFNEDLDAALPPPSNNHHHQVQNVTSLPNPINANHYTITKRPAPPPSSSSANAEGNNNFDDSNNNEDEPPSPKRVPHRQPSQEEDAHFGQRSPTAASVAPDNDSEESENKSGEFTNASCNKSNNKGSAESVPSESCPSPPINKSSGNNNISNSENNLEHPLPTRSECGGSTHSGEMMDMTMCSDVGEESNQSGNMEPLQLISLSRLAAASKAVDDNSDGALNLVDHHGDSHQHQQDLDLRRHHHSLQRHHNNRMMLGDRDDREDRDDVMSNGVDPDYDDDDEDDDDNSFSMNIQPEVSLRESDESYSVHSNSNERRSHHSSPHSGLEIKQVPNLLTTSAFAGLPIGGASTGMTMTPFGTGNALHNLHAFKNFNKLRPLIPKAHQQSSSAAAVAAAAAACQFQSMSEGILMRMMKGEPPRLTVAGGTGSGGSNANVGTVGVSLTSKPGAGSSSSSSSILSHHATSFFDLGHGDTSHHHHGGAGSSGGAAGLRKQKRYVQCTSCSKVLSSLSALKRHMEDVHCARIQGKCLLCGRVYSSRNSLLTHVYSAHKKHHDYKAVARIIRESDFEQFATA